MAVPDFLSWVVSGLRGLKPYDPGHDLVRLRRETVGLLTELGSNENAYGPSAAVTDAIRAALPELYRYPDPLGGDLKRVLADQLSLTPAHILLGNGSHELLMQFAQVFCGAEQEVVASRYGFAVFALAAQAAGAKLRLAEAFPDDALMPCGHDLAAIAAQVTPRTRLIYLANPNNPTGTWFPRRALEDFLADLPPTVLVVVDEAYHEYVDEPDVGSAVDLLPKFPSLVVTRTFSKAYGLAGLRVGYALGHPDLIAAMERVRESFNVNSLGLAAAEAAVGDQVHVRQVRERNALERDWLADELRSRGLGVSPSQTNFLLTRFGARSADIEVALLQRGVVLRPMAGYGLPEYSRITVGRRDENTRLLKALDEVLAC